MQVNQPQSSTAEVITPRYDTIFISGASVKGGDV